ncbi:MAG: DMT family transporter, partial [Alphaproteobacteria bacterium]|nr:DMT family transporter [Alphaproteobacteria bacterium]
TGMVFTFEAYRELRLADATSISFTTPIFATILAATVLRESVGWRRWSAVLIGFAGVLIVAHPGSSTIPLQGALIALGSAFMVAVIAILLRQLGRTEPPATTAFWFCTLSAILLAPAMPWVAVRHDMTEWLLFAGLGLSGAAAQILLSASVKLAPVSIVVNMDYSALIWSVLFGWLLFGELPGMSTWAGVPLIIGSGLYIAWREHVRLRLPA